MARVYASTSPQWMEFHRKLNSQRVCFWQPTPASPEQLEVGDRWYFSRRGANQIDGYGTFAFWEKSSIREAWETYGVSNGCDTKDQFLNLLNEASTTDSALNEDSEIGCVVLIEVAYFGRPIPLKEVGLKPLNVRFEYLVEDDDPIERFSLGIGEQGDVNRDFRLCDEGEVNRSIKLLKDRTGQATFRKSLLATYGNNCALAGLNPPEVLDAAHIQPYANESSNHIKNGILLRADLHRLFDAGVFYIDDGLTVHFDEGFIGEHQSYAQYDGMTLSFANNSDIPVRPSMTALRYHKEQISQI